MSARGRLEHALQHRWYAGHPPEWPLRALSWLYSRMRPKKRSEKPNKSLAARVIVVGNLTAGGTGKTPLVIALVKLAQAQGLKVGVISRGYARRSSGVVVVSANSAWRDCGDEPLLIHLRTAAPVVVGTQRVEAANALLKLGPLDVIISDDGLQHQALPRDVEIVVVDGERGFGNGQLLPAGPLREPVTRLESCDLCVYRGGNHQLRFDLRLGEPYALDSRGPRSWAWLREQPNLLAVSGIGTPEAFFASLRARGLNIKTKALADHQSLAREVIDQLVESVVLMTEKDAVKYRPHPRVQFVVVPAEADLQVPLREALLGLLQP